MSGAPLLDIAKRRPSGQTMQVGLSSASFSIATSMRFITSPTIHPPIGETIQRPRRCGRFSLQHHRTLSSAWGAVAWAAYQLHAYRATRIHDYTQHDRRAVGTAHPLIRLKSGMAGRRIVISVPPCAAAAPAIGYLPTSLPFRFGSRLQGYIATYPTGTQADAIFREFDTSGWSVLIAAAARPERRHVVCRMVAGLAKPPIGRSTSICANTRPRARK